MISRRGGIALALALVMALAAFAAPAATAAKKKKKKAKPVETTLYFHGSETIGEMESFSLLNDAYLPMDPVEPEGASSKSKQITNYAAGPNTACAGNTLFPVWIGKLTGQVKGDVAVSFQSVATPGATVEVRIWPDIASLLCNSTATGTMDYPEPAGSVTVALPPGQATVEAVIEDVNFPASSMLMLQITPVTVPPFFGRVFYDSTAVPSNVTFMCTPAKGKTCTPE